MTHILLAVIYLAFISLGLPDSLLGAAWPVSYTHLDVYKRQTYGYKITQDVRKAIDISESTLYPVLRRLQKENCLETYDMAFDGRNRRYYKLTETGRAQLKLYKSEWTVYSGHISRIFEEANV